MCIFGLFFAKLVHLFKMSFHDEINMQYVLNMKKLPEKLAIDTNNSLTMRKLKLELVSEVKM